MSDFMNKYGDRFTLEELTMGINTLDSNFGVVSKSGLFAGKSVRTTEVAVEYNAGRLTVLASRDRDGETVYQKRKNRKIVTFHIPLFPYSKPIKSSDVQDIKAFGSASELETVDSVIQEYQQAARYNHDVTLEYMQIGALMGKIQDGEGTVLEDLYAKFGISQQKETFFGANTSVEAKARNIVRKISKGLAGDTYTHIEALCSPEFWDKLMADEEFKAAYANYAAVNPLRDDVRDGFKYQGILWKEYNVNAYAADGSELTFVPAGKAVFYPVGTHDTFVYFKAPGDKLELANTMGQDIYSWIWEKQNGRGLTLETQSARLPICTRLNALVLGESA